MLSFLNIFSSKLSLSLPLSASFAFNSNIFLSFLSPLRLLSFNDFILFRAFFFLSRFFCFVLLCNNRQINFSDYFFFDILIFFFIFFVLFIHLFICFFSLCDFFLCKSLFFPPIFVMFHSINLYVAIEMLLIKKSLLSSFLWIYLCSTKDDTKSNAKYILWKFNI